MYFQETLKEFVKLIFPELYNIGSEIEKQTRNFVSNFLIAYLSLYDSKYMISGKYECVIGDVALSSYDIMEIRNVLESCQKLSVTLSLEQGDNYDNIIVKYAISKLFKGIYFREKQFIASFTNAYLYKIGYFNQRQLSTASGTDKTMVDNILIVLSSLDSIISNGTESLRPEEAYV